MRESEARLQVILDHMPAIIYLKDRESPYLVVKFPVVDSAGEVVAVGGVETTSPQSRGSSSR